MVQLQKYPNTFLIVIFVVSSQIVQNAVALTHFLQDVLHVEIHKYLFYMQMSSVGLDKGQASLAARGNWLCLKRNETKVHWESKFLLSLLLKVILYQSGVFILKTITNLPPIMVHRKKMYRSMRTFKNFFWTLGIFWENVCHCNTVLKSFRKTKKTWIVAVGNSAAKTVLVEGQKRRMEIQISFYWKSSVGHFTGWSIVRCHIVHKTVRQIPIGYKIKLNSEDLVLLIL